MWQRKLGRHFDDREDSLYIKRERESVCVCVSRDNDRRLLKGNRDNVLYCEEESVVTALSGHLITAYTCASACDATHTRCFLLIFTRTDTVRGKSRGRRRNTMRGVIEERVPGVNK